MGMQERTIGAPSTLSCIVWKNSLICYSLGKAYSIYFGVKNRGATRPVFSLWQRVREGIYNSPSPLVAFMKLWYKRGYRQREQFGNADSDCMKV